MIETCEKRYNLLSNLFSTKNYKTLSQSRIIRINESYIRNREQI